MSLIIKPLACFVKEIKKLKKRYKNISDDLKWLQNKLLQNPKSGIKLSNNCYKIRVANSSIPTGKSGGFRVIYYYIDDSGVVYLMSIYSKSDLQNLSDDKILQILKDNDLK